MLLAVVVALVLVLGIWLLFVRPAERATQRRKLERIQRKIEVLEARENGRDKDSAQARDSESR